MFLRSSDSSDHPFVIEVIDASLNYDYFNVSSASSALDNSSIYYSSLPVKPLLDSIKPNASFPQVWPNMPDQPIQPRIVLTDDIIDQTMMHLIIREFSLIEEQTLAFRIVADHSLGYGNLLRC